MSDKQTQSAHHAAPGAGSSGKTPARAPLSPQAQRALAEAQARRDAKDKDRDNIPAGPKELQGPAGPEPTRFGDWERKGIASDF